MDRDKLIEERNKIAKWINDAKNNKERQARKTIAFGDMYGEPTMPRKFKEDYGSKK